MCYCYPHRQDFAVILGNSTREKLAISCATSSVCVSYSAPEQQGLNDEFECMPLTTSICGGIEPVPNKHSPSQ